MLKGQAKKKEIVKRVKFTTEKTELMKLGGQHTNGPDNTPVTLTSEETDFQIKIGHYRSNFKNKMLALELFKLYLDETIKQ